MAKKRKKGRRRSYRKKAKRSMPKAKPLGLAGGATLTGMKIATQKDASGMSIVSRTKELVTGTGGTTVDSLVSTTTAAVTQPMNYKYAAAGMVVSAAPRLPLIKMLAGPVDRGLKRLTKGKWGL